MSEELILYHGTAQSNLSSIMLSGEIVPAAKPNWTSPGKVPGIPNAIYFANDIKNCDFYGLRSSIVANDDTYAVLTIKVNTTNLLPDENFLANTDPDGLISSIDMKEAVKLATVSDKWAESLKERGIVAHKGPIKKKNILDIKTELVKNNFWYWLIEDTGTLDEFDSKLDVAIKMQRGGISIDTHKAVLVEGKYGYNDLGYKNNATYKIVER